MRKNNTDLLGEEPIGKLIWRMSIPSMIGILSYNLYNIVDTIYISRGVGTTAAGGLAITFPLFIFLSAVSSTVGAGAASVISVALGKKDIEKASRVAANTFGLFWTVALFITIFGLSFMDELLYLIGVTDTLLPYAREYTTIILIGAVTSTGFSSLMRAEGSSKYAMYQWVIPVLANIILDPIFIFAFHMGITGAAIATVASQCISVIMSLYYFFFSGKSQLKIRLHHFLPDVKILVELLSIGLPSFLSQMSNSLTIIVINHVLRQYGGDIAISTYGIANKVIIFLMIPLQGIVQGIQPIIGYNYGAVKYHRVKAALKRSCTISLCYGILISCLLFMVSDWMIYCFSSEAQVLQLGSRILKIACLALTFTGLQMIFTTYFQAIGRAGMSLVLIMAHYLLCFVPVMLLLSSLFGLDGVWYSFPLSAIISMGISALCILSQLPREGT